MRHAAALVLGLLLVAGCGEPAAKTETVPAPEQAAPESPDAPAATEIVWEPDLATAQARSAETGRPVLAYFTFDT